MTVITTTNVDNNNNNRKRNKGAILHRTVLAVATAAATTVILACYWMGNDNFADNQQQTADSILMNEALLRIKQRQQTEEAGSNGGVSSSVVASTEVNAAVATTILEETFQRVNDKLLGPNDYGTTSCPSSCGCAETPVDCTRWYQTADIMESVRMQDQHDQELQSLVTRQLAESKTKAMQGCNVNTTSLVADKSKGGWCLHPDAECTKFECTIKHKYNKISFPLPQQHVVAYRRIVVEIAAMIEQEEISSLSDFGAGVGQYKAKLMDRFPSTSALTYNAYDGAGNIESYTKNQVQYFDLTVPLSLPITDWVMCLEVGEHVPSKYEGMVIRNLHRHNRKGIILSWSVLGQKGLAHVNNHSPSYILGVFEDLGYTLDQNLTYRFRMPNEQNYWWFHESIMVLRRTT